MVLSEIESIPEPFLTELLDFIRFLETKLFKQKMGIAIASESSLRKDWLRPEEDKAWKGM